MIVTAAMIFRLIITIVIIMIKPMIVEVLHRSSVL